MKKVLNIKMMFVVFAFVPLAAMGMGGAKQNVMDRLNSIDPKTHQSRLEELMGVKLSNKQREAFNLSVLKNFSCYQGTLNKKPQPTSPSVPLAQLPNQEIKKIDTTFRDGDIDDPLHDFGLDAEKIRWCAIL